MSFQARTIGLLEGPKSFTRKDTRSVRASHDLARVSASFDEANLVPCAGLLPAAALAQRLDVAGLVEERLTLARHGANSGTKALTVIGAMVAGGDSIDDTDLLRAGALPQLFDMTRAPSTVGTWLRDFKWHNVRQLDAVSRELLARQWAAGAGPVDLAAPMTIDVDSTIVPVFGRGKQGAAFGYTKIRGYHPQLATLAETGQVLFARLRGGAAGAARGAKSFLTETFSRVRAAGATGELTLRAARRSTPRRCWQPRPSSTSGSPSPPARTARSGPRSRRSASRRGRRSRTGCPHRRSPAPMSPRPTTPPSPAPSTR
jgi:hypothetical protein